MYRALATHIASVCCDIKPASLLDIGFGSGLALAPALKNVAATGVTNLPSLLLLEPSLPMLAQGLQLLQVSESPHAFKFKMAFHFSSFRFIA